MRTLILLLGLFGQDPPKDSDVVLAKLPEFYWSSNVVNFRHEDTPENPLPKNDGYRYFLQKTDYVGRPIGKAEQVSVEDFYAVIRCVLNYGVRDSASIFWPAMNTGFRDYLKLLLDRNLITRQRLEAAAKSYTSSQWVESLYWLDEACPGLFPESDLNNVEVASNMVGRRYYFPVLLGIKRSRGDPEKLKTVQRELDEKLKKLAQTGKSSEVGQYFAEFSNSYAQLAGRGLVISEETQRALLYAYLQIHPEPPMGIFDTYNDMGLRLPSIKIMEAAFEDAMASADKPRIGLIKDFRQFKMNFPRARAKAYLNALVEKRESLEDIEYMIQSTGENGITPEAWLEYGNSAYGRIFIEVEARVAQRDFMDYYHASVGAYKRVADAIAKLGNDPESKRRAGLLKIKPERLGYLRSFHDDFSARMRDLIVAYELNGTDFREEAVMESLNKRANLYEKLKTGFYYDDSLVIRRRWDALGNTRIPFRDSVELAAAVGDGARTRALSRRIADWALDGLADEGQDRFRHYNNQRCVEISEWETVRKELYSLDAPIFMNLELIADLYEELNFTDGARSLAAHLHDVGLVVPARRLFKLGGLGDRACPHCSALGEKELIKIQQKHVFQIRSN